MGIDNINVASVMQVIAWIAMTIGLLVTVRTTARSGRDDQVALENRLTKIESTLTNIDNAIVKGELVAKVTDLDSRVKTIEERGCGFAEHCSVIRRDVK